MGRRTLFTNYEDKLPGSQMTLSYSQLLLTRLGTRLGYGPASTGGTALARVALGRWKANHSRVAAMLQDFPAGLCVSLPLSAPTICSAVARPLSCAGRGGQGGQDFEGTGREQGTVVAVSCALGPSGPSS